MSQTRPTFVLCEVKPMANGQKQVTVRTKDGVQMTYYFDTVADAYRQAQRDYTARMMDKREVK